jgi:hypothetical protein
VDEVVTYIIMVQHADGQRRPLTRGLTVRMFETLDEARKEALRRNLLAQEVNFKIWYEAVTREET